MARLANALRLALGGATGALEGYGAKQERLRKDELLRQERERQAMYDTLQLLDRGALPSAQRQAVGQAAAGEIAKAVSGAMGAFQSGAQTPFDAEAIARGAGRMGAPAAQFKIGDVTFDMPDPEQRRKAREAQEAAAALTQQRKLTQAEQEEKDKRLDAEARRIQTAYGTSYGKPLSLDEARQIAAGRRPSELGRYTADERKRMALDEKKALADIEQSQAAAAASRAAAALSRAGGRRSPEELRDNLITATAKYSTTVDETTGALPTKEQVQQYYSTLSSLAGIPIPLEQEFNLPAELSKITQLRKQGFGDEEIRAALRRAKAASQPPR